MSDLPRTPAENLLGIIRSLSTAADERRLGGWMTLPVMLLIMARIRAIGQLFARIAARINAGTYVPRQATARRRRTPQKPRPPNPLPNAFGWMIRLVPGTAVYGSQLQYLFRDPAMAALMQAAPGPLRRPLHSLCWMLGVHPPPILARPPSLPAPAAPPPTPAPTPPVEEPQTPLLPHPGVPTPDPAPPPIARACGPPLPQPA